MKYFLSAVFLIGMTICFHVRADDFFVSCLNDNSIIKISGGDATVFATGKAPFWGLAVDRMGNLYVSSEGDNAILKFASVGGILSTTPTVFAGNLHGPLGLAFDQAGNLYEAERSGNIDKFPCTGGTLSNLPSLFVDGSADHANLLGSRQPDALAFDRQGNLYVAIEIGGILRFTNTASGLSNLPDDKPFSTVSRAREMAFDKDGNLFTANHLAGENYVYEYANSAAGLSGVPKIFAKGHGLDGPYGLTIDSSGNLFVTNWGGYSGTEILEYYRTGGVLAQTPVVYGSDFGSPVIMVAVKR